MSLPFVPDGTNMYMYFINDTIIFQCPFKLLTEIDVIWLCFIEIFAIRKQTHWESLRPIVTTYILVKFNLKSLFYSDEFTFRSWWDQHVLFTNLKFLIYQWKVLQTFYLENGVFREVVWVWSCIARQSNRWWCID